MWVVLLSSGNKSISYYGDLYGSLFRSLCTWVVINFPYTYIYRHIYTPYCESLFPPSFHHNHNPPFSKGVKCGWKGLFEVWFSKCSFQNPTRDAGTYFFMMNVTGPTIKGNTRREPVKECPIIRNSNPPEISNKAGYEKPLFLVGAPVLLGVVGRAMIYIISNMAPKRFEKSVPIVVQSSFFMAKQLNFQCSVVQFSK